MTKRVAFVLKWLVIRFFTKPVCTFSHVTYKVITLSRSASRVNTFVTYLSCWCTCDSENRYKNGFCYDAISTYDDWISNGNIAKYTRSRTNKCVISNGITYTMGSFLCVLSNVDEIMGATIRSYTGIRVDNDRTWMNNG